MYRIAMSLCNNKINEQTYHYDINENQLNQFSNDNTENVK